MPLHCRKSRVTGLMALLVVSAASCKTEPDVCPHGPLALNEMPDLQMLIGEVEEISLPHYFGEPCRRELSYTASSAASSAATVSITGVTLTVTAVDEVDSAIVRVEAGNSENQFAAHRFYVSVEHPNRAPIAIGSIRDFELPVQRFDEVNDIDTRFFDPDGDPLTYCTRGGCPSADPEIATGKMAGTTLRVLSGGVPGSTTITVSATDPEGLSASHYVSVTVTEDG